MHLILDSYTRRDDLLSDAEGLKALLLKVVGLMRMRPISDPYVLDYDADGANEGGLSGFIFLAESNVVVHTYPIYQVVFIDVFSCRGFNREVVERILVESFGMISPSSYVLDRGIADGIVTLASLRENNDEFS